MDRSANCRIWLVCIGLVILAVQAGCSMCVYGTRNLVKVPLHYQETMERFALRKKYRREAQEVLDQWEFLEDQAEGTGFSHDYSRGFVAGYSDYRLLGSRAAPPPVPPRDYWRTTGYEQREDVQWAPAEEWYAGFDMGMQIACYLMPGSRTVPNGETHGESDVVPISDDSTHSPKSPAYPLPPPQVS